MGVTLEVVPFFAGLPASWTDERTRVAHLQTELQTHVYTGLRELLPMAQRIESWPRMAYIGLLYHQKNLTDPAEIAEFANYAVGAAFERYPVLLGNICLSTIKLHA
jgi:hypothetical protein